MSDDEELREHMRQVLVITPQILSTAADGDAPIKSIHECIKLASDLKVPLNSFGTHKR